MTSHYQKHQRIVRINVGGIEYSTTLGTLTAVKGSYFTRLFAEETTYCSALTNGDSAAAVIEQQPISVFVDRDGQHFRHVLNYLRDGLDVVLPRNEEVFEQLLSESRFYGLTEFSELLVRKLEEDRPCEQPGGRSMHEAVVGIGRELKEVLEAIQDEISSLVSNTRTK